MSTIICKKCKAEVSVANSEIDSQPLICPNCRVLLQAAKARLDPFKLSNRRLPGKMSMKMIGDQLIITRRWFGLVHIGLGVITSFLLIFGLFFSELSRLEFLFNPLSWFVIGLNYYALSHLINRTVVRISPELVRVKQGPLPPWRNRTLKADELKQLYVKEHVERNNKGSTTSYQLHLVGGGNHREEVISGLETAEQALFLEQEIERVLGIEDQVVAGEYEASETYDFSNWQRFAHSNHLAYTAGKLLEGHRVHGHYRNYGVELMTVQPRLKVNSGRVIPRVGINASRTRLTLTRPPEGKSDEQGHPSLSEVKRLFAASFDAAYLVQGTMTSPDKGVTLAYEQDRLETDSSRLQLIFDASYNLIEAYPKIVQIGGEVIPELQTVADDKKHPARPLAGQLIRAIAPTTHPLQTQQLDSLVCPRCLRRCTKHEVSLSWSSAPIYYGCSQCHQSKEFLTTDRVIAVLDTQAGAEPIQEGTTLYVNWLLRRTLFDFDAVEIIQANDEQVERFAVQVGNNIDPVRQAAYKEMACLVSPGCQLSANTMRILQRTFGQVEGRTGS